MYGKGLIKGLGVTLGHHMKKKITTQYPEQRPELAPRFRGCLEYDMDRCIACSACVRACPNTVLTLTTGRGADGKRKPATFVIDLQYCLFCAFCVEVCPTNCLYFSPNFELACFTREQSKRKYQADIGPEEEPAVAVGTVPEAVEAPGPLAKKQELAKRLAAQVSALKKELNDPGMEEEERQQKQERLTKLSAVLAKTTQEVKELKHSSAESPEKE